MFSPPNTLDVWEVRRSNVLNVWPHRKHIKRISPTLHAISLHIYTYARAWFIYCCHLKSNKPDTHRVKGISRQEDVNFTYFDGVLAHSVNALIGRVSVNLSIRDWWWARQSKIRRYLDSINNIEFVIIIFLLYF